jgi:hypothetical protein
MSYLENFIQQHKMLEDEKLEEEEQKKVELDPLTQSFNEYKNVFHKQKA